MAEISAEGYTQLRTGTPVDEWFMELRDDSNNPVPILADPGPGTVNRLSGSDSRLTVTDDSGTQTTTFALVLDGDDVQASEGSPVTVQSSVLYAAVSGGSPLTAVESFDPFVFSGSGDQVTISHHVEAPQQGV